MNRVTIEEVASIELVVASIKRKETIQKMLVLYYAKYRLGIQSTVVTPEQVPFQKQAKLLN